MHSNHDLYMIYIVYIVICSIYSDFQVAHMCKGHTTLKYILADSQSSNIYFQYKRKKKKENKDTLIEAEFWLDTTCPHTDHRTFHLPPNQPKRHEYHIYLKLHKA